MASNLTPPGLTFSLINKTNMKEKMMVEAGLLLKPLKSPDDQFTFLSSPLDYACLIFLCPVPQHLEKWILSTWKIVYTFSMKSHFINKKMKAQKDQNLPINTWWWQNQVPSFSFSNILFILLLLLKKNGLKQKVKNDLGKKFSFK